MTTDEIISKAERLVAAGSIDEALELLLKFGYLNAATRESKMPSTTVPMTKVLTTGFIN